MKQRTTTRIIVLLFFHFVQLHADVVGKKILTPLSMTSGFSNYRIGALVPVHIAKDNRTLCMQGDPKYSFIRTKDGTTVCYLLNDSGVMWAEAIRFAVLEINKRKILGENITLGYDIRDTVNNVDVALDAALDFTMTRRRINLTSGECTCSENETEPYVVAVIGGARSEISQRVNHALSVASLPQISYSSTSVALSNKKSYRTFLRTIPPDNYQAKAMADLCHRFKWHYVATVATDEDYGRRGVMGFHEEARKLDICISTHRLFPLSSLDSKSQIQQIVKDLIADKRSNVIVLFCERPRARDFLKEAEEQGMTGKTWIASEDWGSTDKIYHFKDSVVGGIVGVITYEPLIDSFTRHLEQITPTSKGPNPWVADYFKTVDPRPNLNASIIHRNKAAYVYDSVFTVAYALRDYFKCHRSGKPSCPKKVDLTKLREFMLAVNFTGVAGDTVAFDEVGDPKGKYQISNMQPVPEAKFGKEFVIVGSWINGNLKFNKSLKWNGWKDAVPVSNCSFPCPRGKGYVSGDQSCCWTCVLCPAGHFKAQVGNLVCDSCPTGYISNQNRTKCLRIPEEFIKWDSVTSAILVSLSLFGLLVSSFMFGVYFKYQHSPIVKASSRHPSLVLLVIVALMFLLPFLYIGRPNSAQCHAQPIALGLLMTLATSLVFTKTFRLIQIFNNVVANVRDQALVSVRTQFVIVTVFVVIEVIIIGVFLDQKPMEIRTTIQDTAVPVDCGESAKYLHITVLLYNGLLAVICAVMAFRARSLPANFSEARLISFAMFTFSVIWITFLITYSGSFNAARHSTFVSVAILATALDLLVCMFAPKIWVILFRPELNEMHVVRADIYRYTLKQRSRSHTAYMENSETDFERDRIDTRPQSEMPTKPEPAGDFDCVFDESKL